LIHVAAHGPAAIGHTFRRSRSRARKALPDGAAPDRRYLQGLSHPVRLDFMRRLDDAGEISPSQYATESGEPLANASYHVRTLEAAEIVAVVQTHGRRGAVEQRYAVSGENGAVALALIDFLVKL
jgi:DNA-binding transcriptional ArsR family regulator